MCNLLVLWDTITGKIINIAALLGLITECSTRLKLAKSVALNKQSKHGRAVVLSETDEVLVVGVNVSHF